MKLKKLIAGAMTTVFLSAVPLSAQAASVTNFKDVLPGAWYYGAVEYAADTGLFAGTGADTFNPDMSMTRGMFVTVLGRKAGVSKEKPIATSFSDVKPVDYYSPYVEWAAKNKIVSGKGGGIFDPGGRITREQMAAILYRYAKLTGAGNIQNGTEILRFPDTGDVADYAKEPMTWAVDKKIINGSDGKLDPKGTATRAQVAQVFLNAKEVLVNSEINPDTEPEPELELYTDTWTEDQNPYEIVRQVKAGTTAQWNSGLNDSNAFSELVIDFVDWGDTHYTADWAIFNTLELLNDTGADQFCIREKLVNGKPQQALTLYYTIPEKTDSPLMTAIRKLVEAEFPGARFSPEAIRSGHGWRGASGADDNSSIAENAQRIAGIELRYLREWFGTSDSFYYWLSEPEPGVFYFFY